MGLYHQEVVRKHREARGKRHVKSKENTLPKIGLTEEKIGMIKKKALDSFYSRKRVLTVPKEIQTAHPDKHFVYVNFNKLQKSGMYHSQGYRLFKAEDSESMEANKFNKDFDGYVHRNEMALAYIPKEEYEARQIEWEIVRGKKDFGDIITDHPDMQEFEPFADVKTTRGAPRIQEEVANG